MTLQFTRRADDAWRTVMRIDANRRDEAVAAAAHLADILGPRTRWAILHPDGRREPLTFGGHHAQCH